MATGEPLYLITSSSKTAAKYADEYPRQGFDHYFKMGITIWGAVQCFLLIIYVILFIAKRTKLFNEADFVKNYHYGYVPAYNSTYLIMNNKPDGVNHKKIFDDFICPHSAATGFCPN